MVIILKFRPSFPIFIATQRVYIYLSIYNLIDSYNENLRTKALLKNKIRTDQLLRTAISLYFWHLFRRLFRESRFNVGEKYVGGF